MTPKARRCIEWVLAREGGYVNRPADRGGPTKYGISKRAYPELDVTLLTEPQAAEIYERDYWKPSRAEEYDEPLALALFDYAVHSGVEAARAALKSVSPPTLDLSAKELAKRLVVQRATFLVRRALTEPDQDVFLEGWMQRVLKLNRAIGKMA